MLLYTNTQVIVLIFINFDEILSKIHEALASLLTRFAPYPKAEKSVRLPELLEWASLDPLVWREGVRPLPSCA